MYIGSVKFFKHSIVFLLIVIPAILITVCVALAVRMNSQGSEIDELKETVEFYEVLIGGGDINAEFAYNFIINNKITPEEILAVIDDRDSSALEGFLQNRGGGSANNLDSANNADNAGNNSTVSDMTDEPSQTTPASSSETTPPQTSPPDTQTTPVQTTEPEVPLPSYTALYADMVVTEPDEYVAEENTVYLTFDDGPSKYTANILEYLRIYGIEATFFVIPKEDESSVLLMQQIVNAGHSIGIHTYSHEYETIYASVENYLEDFNKAWELVYQTTGVKSEIFRFPGGSINDYNKDTYKKIIAEMNRRGFRYYDWNIDSLDSQGADWTTMYTTVLEETKDKARSIILMHDSNNGYNTVLVLEDIIDALLARGLKFDKIHNNTKPMHFNY